MKNIIKNQGLSLLKILTVAILFSACSPEKVSEQKLKQKKAQLEKLQDEVKKLESAVQSDSSKSIFRIPVKIKEMKPETFKHFVESSGTIEAVNQAVISPEMGGQIKEIHVKEGSRVEKGDLLVSLNTDVTEATIKEIKTGLELADTLYQRQKRLYKEGIGSEIQMLQAKSTKEQAEARLSATQSQMRMSKIYAPFSGIVDEVLQKKGELSSPGVPILMMVNLSKMRVVADVSETYVPAVKSGDLVNVVFPTYPDINLEVPVKRTGNIINPANRTFQVEIEFSNIQNKLKPNMLGIISINDYTLDSALIVPSIIIKKDIAVKGVSNKFLFIAIPEGDGFVAQKVYVKPGRSFKDKTVVEEGLKPGDKVIVEGYNTVSTGAAIKF